MPPGRSCTLLDSQTASVSAVRDSHSNWVKPRPGWLSCGHGVGYAQWLDTGCILAYVLA